MANSISLVSSFVLEEMILDKWCDVSELEQNTEVENGLTGNDLTFAQMHNESISVEIRIIKQTILAIKAEIYSRVRIK